MATPTQDKEGTKVMTEPTVELNGLCPMPGQLFAIPKQAISERMGLIWIPEVARRNPGFRATVVAESPRRGGTGGYVGREVLFHTGVGQMFDWRCEYDGGEYESLIRYPLSQSVMTAVCYEDVWMPITNEVMGAGVESLPGEDGVKRCRSCRSRGDGNIILDGNDVCPQCGKFESGRKFIPFRHTMNEGTIMEEVIETDFEPKFTDEEMSRFSAPKPKKKKGTIFSYDKQGKKS